MGTKIPTNQKGVVVCSFLLEKALVPIRACILVPPPPEMCQNKVHGLQKKVHYFSVNIFFARISIFL